MNQCEMMVAPMSERNMCRFLVETHLIGSIQYRSAIESDEIQKQLVLDHKLFQHSRLRAKFCIPFNSYGINKVLV